MTEKALVFDSGTLINLSMNGLLYILEELKKISNVKFLITKEVKYETVDRPIGIPRFELGALRVQNLIDSKIIEMPESLNISEEKIENTTKELMNITNHSIKAIGRWINIVSNAEMSCLALSIELTSKGIENIIAIDERTTRILAEKPENLEEIMSTKLHTKIALFKKNLSMFSQFKFVRSTELVYVAFKKGVLKVQGNKALEAALYATKYKGSSVSFEEIDVLKKL
ncbi:hypothetical protein HYV50_00360 [Candidatus Pacearchaeota archaeon]|nr:hypothetical protein [Candidatus Pacearchaeota archaeon]